MKTKVLLTAVLLAATNFAYASGGGLSLDSEQNVENNDDLSEIVAQNATDELQVEMKEQKKVVAENFYVEDPYNDLGV